jgi:hypothetical protein
MDLADIRNRVIQKTGIKDVDRIDSEVNFVQREYVQPLCKIEGEVYYQTTEAEKVSSEVLSSTDYLVFQADYKPIKPYSDRVYISSVESSRDSTTYPTVDYDAGTFTFATTQGSTTITADYESMVVEDTTNIATDVYRINSVMDVTDGSRWNGVNLLSDFKGDGCGIRQHNDKLYFHGIDGDRTLLFNYHKTLTDLSESNATPTIPSQWHDLYWLGAASMINPDFFALFTDRLEAYKLDIVEETRPRGQRLKVTNGWW